MGVEQDDNFDIMGGMAEDAHAAKPILPPGLADSDQADIVLFARAEHINPTAYESLPADAKSLLDLHEKALTDGTILHHFDRAKASNKIFFPDMDHTVYDRGIILDDEKRLDISKYSAIEKQNIDLLLIHALIGNPIAIETGKEANIWPMATYMRNRLDKLAKVFGMTEEKRQNNTFTDGRLRSFDGSKPVIFTFSTGNGGLTYELTAPDPTKALIVYKPIPVDSWEAIQRDEDLLRASADPVRIRQLTGLEPDGSAITHPDHLYDAKGRKIPREIDLGDGDALTTFRMTPRVKYEAKDDPYTKQQWAVRTDQTHHIDTSHIDTRDRLRREVAPELTPGEMEHRMLVQRSVKDIIAVSPLSVKGNIVFLLAKIVNDPVLNEAWFERTGVRIEGETEVEQRASLFEACQVLAQSWEDVSIAQAYAGRTFYLDIAAKGVDKRANARWVKKWVQALSAIEQLEEEDLPVTGEAVTQIIENADNKLWSIKLGDGGRYSNDDKMLRSGGGALVQDYTEEEGEGQAKPVRLSRIFGDHGNLVLTNKLLLFHLLAQNFADETIRDEVKKKLLLLDKSIYQNALVKRINGRVAVIKSHQKPLPLFTSEKVFLSFIEKALHPDVDHLAINFAYPMTPISRNGYLDGRLIMGTKEHSFDGLVGKLVGETIEKHVKDTYKRIIHVALANDTVCLLLSGLTQFRWQGLVGGIIGTGLNFAIFLDEGTIVNLEAANFDKFPQSAEGKRIDKASARPKSALIEKEIAGGYLYQHFNMRLEKEGLDFPEIKSTKKMDEVAFKNIPLVSLLAREVSDHSSSLVSCEIAGIADFLKRDCTVVIEGSLFWKGWRYKENVSIMVRQLVPQYQVSFVFVEESGVLGAAKLVS